MQNAECECNSGELRGPLPDQARVTRQRTTDIDMAGDGVDFLTVDQQLDTLDRRQVGGDGVDDRVDRQQLGQRPAGMRGRDASC